MDIPDFVPNRRREDNLKKGGWRKYGRTASLSSSSETSASNSSDDEKELVFHATIPGGCEDLSDACAGLDNLEIQNRRVRFSEDEAIDKNPKSANQGCCELLKPLGKNESSEKIESTSEHMQDGDAGVVCEDVHKAGNADAVGENSKCGNSNTVQTKNCHLCNRKSYVLAGTSSAY